MKLSQLIICTFLFTTLSLSAQTTEKKITKNEVLEDLDFLYTSLKDAHYDVYAYVSKGKFDTVYHQTKALITNDSLTQLEATTIFQQLISAVNNGHTEIDFPIDAYKIYAYAEGTVFPLEIAIEDKECLVRKNFSDKPEIKIGAKIISINGKPMQDILEKIHLQISAESTYLKNAKLEAYSFPRYYWQVFGQQDSFNIEIYNEASIENYSIAAVNLIQGFEMKRTEVLNAAMTYHFTESTAYLNPGNFGGDEAQYQHFIDSSFVEINKKASKNLIIDLRNNRGGDNSFSDYLVSYIADKPFDWNASLTLKTSKFLKEHTRLNNDTTDVYFQEILNHKDGEVYDYKFDKYLPQAPEKRFKGKVYVLVNRQSYSQSAVTAAQIQDYKFGTIVGEETAEYPSLHASQFQYALPHTGTIVKVAKGYIVRVNGSKKQEGVMPDIIIKDQLLDETDEILNGLLERLKQ